MNPYIERYSANKTLIDAFRKIRIKYFPPRLILSFYALMHDLS